MNEQILTYGGIYCITCKKTGAKYIGQTKRFKTRFQEHDKDRFPKEVYDYEILYVMVEYDKGFLDVIEAYYIEYNFTKGGLNLNRVRECTRFTIYDDMTFTINEPWWYVRNYLNETMFYQSSVYNTPSYESWTDTTRKISALLETYRFDNTKSLKTRVKNFIEKYLYEIDNRCFYQFYNEPLIDGYKEKVINEQIQNDLELKRITLEDLGIIKHNLKSKGLNLFIGVRFYKCTSKHPKERGSIYEYTDNRGNYFTASAMKHIKSLKPQGVTVRS